MDHFHISVSSVYPIILGFLNAAESKVEQTEFWEDLVDEGLYMPAWEDSNAYKTIFVGGGYVWLGYVYV